MRYDWTTFDPPGITQPENEPLPIIQLPEQGGSIRALDKSKYRVRYENESEQSVDVVIERKE